MSDVYTHGHHDSVLRSHRWRTAENSAGYLVDYLQPGMSLLDIGCGWGALIMHAARNYGVDATGITLSEAQASLATETSVLMLASGIAFSGTVYS